MQFKQFSAHLKQGIEELKVLLPLIT